jgi:hypothetical protein
VKEATYLFKDHVEAPAMVKIGSRYYFFGSHLTGWDPNDNVSQIYCRIFRKCLRLETDSGPLHQIYTTSTSLTSGWTSWATFADAKSNTYSSQTNYILDYGSGNVMYMGDRWVSKDLQSSSSMWLPLTISSTDVRMKNHDAWVPNVAGGAWREAPASTAYDANDGTYAGGAKDVSCSGCSGGKAAGYIGGDKNGKVTVSGIKAGSAGPTTVTIRYVNGDSKPRYANMAVNGATPVKVAFEPTGSGSSGSSTFTVELKGNSNEIAISGVDGGWGPDIDRLLVPTT